ncbi:BnaC09g20980D [Brassica napus]|nr:BnaC09g20980D [Brassica napus]
MTLETMTASRDHRYVRSEKLKKFTGFLETSESCDGLVCIYGMTIPIKLMNAASGNPRPVFANGSFYWLTGDGEGYPTTQTKLIVFDIHTEMFQVTETPPFVKRDACGDKIGVCNLDGCLCVSELKADCKQEFWWRVKDQLWEKIFSVDLNSTSTWFGGVTSQPLTPLTILKDKNKVILSLSYQDNLVSFDLDPHSTVYHLYLSGYYGLAVPYFPSLFTIL